MKISLLALLAVALAACAADTTADEDMGVSEAACHELYQGLDLSPALKNEYDKIIHTKTGNSVAKKAKAHHLKAIKAGKHGGDSKYENGTIVIPNPDGEDAFANLAKELLNAGGFHPDFVPDKDLLGKICNEAKAKCASMGSDADGGSY